MSIATRLKWLGLTGLLFALVLGGFTVKGLTNDVRPVRPGSRAPDFHAVHLETGETVTLADYEGRVVLLNIWATWCAPCEVEMPSMQRLHDRLGPKGLHILAVSIDDEDPDFVRQWVSERGLTFEILHDRTGQVVTDYQATGWPESFVINKDGVIVRKAWGAKDWDAPEESNIFRRLLGLPETDGEG